MEPFFMNRRVAFLNRFDKPCGIYSVSIHISFVIRLPRPSFLKGAYQHSAVPCSTRYSSWCVAITISAYTVLQPHAPLIKRRERQLKNKNVPNCKSKLYGSSSDQRCQPRRAYAVRFWNILPRPNRAAWVINFCPASAPRTAWKYSRVFAIPKDFLEKFLMLTIFISAIQRCWWSKICKQDC